MQGGLRGGREGVGRGRRVEGGREEAGRRRRVEGDSYGGPRSEGPANLDPGQHDSLKD